MDLKLYEQFEKLFTGHSDGYGTYILPKKKPEDQIKFKGKASTVHKKVTSSLYSDHLAGKQGLGIIPVDYNGKVLFSAIDIDKYNEETLLKLSKEVEDLQLPFIPCRTKSGGVHLFLFFKSKTEAPPVINFLKQISRILGYAGAEIFPKQEKIASERDLGNWINLPYFDQASTDRYAVKKGVSLSLSEFIKYAIEKKVDQKDLDKILIRLQDKELDDLSDAPICIQRICAKGVEQGTKNNVLLNIGVYLKQKFPDDWEKVLKDFNQKYVKPPAKEETLKKVIKPLKRKDYFYTCGLYPLTEHCDKTACKLCEFGIGDNLVVNLGKLVKIDTDPPTWILEVDDIKIELSTEEILAQEKFRKACVEKVQKLPYRMLADVWDELIRQKLGEVTLVDAPQDAGTEGQFLRLVDEFCSTRAMAKTREEVLMGKPYQENGYIYFRSADLLRFLEQNKFRDFKTKKVWSTLKKHRAIYQNLQLKGRHVRLWGIPEGETQTEEFETPNVKTSEF